jgi:hypothetical protein
MKILGYILIVIGSLLFLSRMLNQPIQLRNLKSGAASLKNYIIAELLMGWILAVILIYLGYLLVK